MKVVYIGQATHDASSYGIIDEHIAQARSAMIRLVNAGIGAPDVPADFWYELDLRMLHACDALYRLPGASRGADAEEMGLPVYYDLDEIIARHEKGTLV